MSYAAAMLIKTKDPPPFSYFEGGKNTDCQNHGWGTRISESHPCPVCKRYGSHHKRLKKLYKLCIYRGEYKTICLVASMVNYKQAISTAQFAIFTKEQIKSIDFD